MMDTNFNPILYQFEMLSLVNAAIKKLKAEHPDYEVFTMSLTTDFTSGVSAVHFDSRASSERYLKKEAEQYQKYLQAGNPGMAEMYAPTGEILRILNFHSTQRFKMNPSLWISRRNRRTKIPSWKMRRHPSTGRRPPRF